MSRLMITAAPETNRWNEGQLIPETLISAMAQLVGEADYIHLSQLVAEHALRADNGPGRHDPRVISSSLCGRDCQR
jgi:hypothetical protein